MATCFPDSLNLSASDIVMPVVPMFHVNAWGVPYSAAMVGCTIVLPGPNLDGDSLASLIYDYKVTIALGVPTIWQGLLAAAKTRHNIRQYEPQCCGWRCMPTVDYS